MNRGFLLAALTLALGACAGNPQRLPLAVSRCDAVTTARGFAVSAAVENKAGKPISSIGLSLAFYHDFRYAQFTAAAHLKNELDPGEKRDVTFDVTGPSVREAGTAMRCLVTHVGYLDGTSADIGPSQ